MNILRKLIAFALLCSLAQAGVTFRIVFQDGSSSAWPITPGWNYCTGPLGATQFDDLNQNAVPTHTLRIGNDVGDAGPGGSIFFKRLEIDVSPGPIAIPPRHGWTVQDGHTIVIGSAGEECLPPRSSLRVRWVDGDDWTKLFDLPPPPVWGVTLGRQLVRTPDEPRWVADGLRVRDRFMEALKNGTVQQYTGSLIPTLRELPVGIWRPHLMALSDDSNGGGHGIEPIPWERVPEVILYHDAAMERHAVGWRAKATGEPLPSLDTANGHYSLARYWTDHSVPESVSAPWPGDPSSDKRIPLHWNAGVCPYEARLAAVDVWGGSYNGFPAHNGQHMIRATYRGKVAAEWWLDKCAADDLRMIAQDCRYAWPAIPAVNQGAGSGSMGRELYWVIDALIAGGMPRHAYHLAQAVLKAQMLTGPAQRLAYPAPVIPNWWAVSPDVPDPLPITIDGAASMELMFQEHALLRCGFVVEAGNSVRATFEFASERGYIPKAFGVADHGAAPHRAFTEWCGSMAYFGSNGVGEWALADLPHLSEILEYALDFPTPTQGMATSLSDLKLKTIREETGRSQVVALLAALEAALK